jgi:hypothetical protein
MHLGEDTTLSPKCWMKEVSMNTKNERSLRTLRRLAVGLQWFFQNRE